MKTQFPARLEVNLKFRGGEDTVQNGRALTWRMAPGMDGLALGGGCSSSLRDLITLHHGLLEGVSGS